MLRYLLFGEFLQKLFIQHEHLINSRCILLKADIIKPKFDRYYFFPLIRHQYSHTLKVKWKKKSLFRLILQKSAIIVRYECVFLLLLCESTEMKRIRRKSTCSGNENPCGEFMLGSILVYTQQMLMHVHAYGFDSILMLSDAGCSFIYGIFFPVV